jgi:predicted TIM-barrel fold metal-dependent hydrolase
MIKPCPPPDPNPRPPRLKAPPGAIDTHFHIFGPEALYPFLPERRFTPPDASVAAYLEMHRTLGLSRAVLVQPSMYGTDNRRQLDAAREMGIPTRAIVVVPAAVADKELEDLWQQGARGVRFNPSQPGSLPLDQLERFADRLAGLGWHIQLMMTPKQLAELAPRLVKLACPIVIDHIGDIRSSEGMRQPAFQALLDLLRGDRCWIKLSAGYHHSDQDPPYPETIPFGHALVRERPDRLFWGSDWPHANHWGRMPNSTDLLDLLIDWVPDETVRAQILVDNPERFYGF